MFQTFISNTWIVDENAVRIVLSQSKTTSFEHVAPITLGWNVDFYRHWIQNYDEIFLYWIYIMW